jgi:hypothetical protein
MPSNQSTISCEQVFAMAGKGAKKMNYDVTLLSRANQPTARSLPVDIVRMEDHMGIPIARTIRVRQTASAWLHQLANRVASRPIEPECEELFGAIAAMLSEPVCEDSALKTASHQRC